MRFCFLTTFFPPRHFGGDAVFVANLANALASRGHEIQVVHCEDSFNFLAGSVQPSEFFIHPSIQVHSLRLGLASPVLTYLSGRPGIKAGILSEVLSQDFDVVHWHNLSLIGGPGALPLARGVRLCTLHDYWLLCPTHILFRYDGVACASRKCLRCTVAHKRLPQPWRSSGLIGDNLTYVDRFIAPSEFASRLYRDSPMQIRPAVLHHFIDLERPPAAAKTSGYYLFVGRLEKAKGLQNILPLFPKSGSRRLVVAGAGNMEAGLRELAGPNPNVEFIGRVPWDELDALYSGALATLVPSICYETFGLTLLESLRCGTPVIASNFGALPEVVRLTGGGWVFDSVGDLEKILVEVESSPDRSRAIGTEARKRLGPFSLQHHLDGYFALIDQVLAERPVRN